MTRARRGAGSAEIETTMAEVLDRAASAGVTPLESAHALARARLRAGR